jgi:hypothetical protein
MISEVLAIIWSQASHRPVGKFVYREIYSCSELSDTLWCFLAWSYDLDIIFLK